MKNRKSQQKGDMKNEVELLEVKNKITKIKSSVDEFKSRVERTKGRLHELEYKTVEITQSEQQREKNTKNKLQDYNKRSNIFVIGVPEGEQRVGLNKYSKMAETFQIWQKM